MTCSIFDKTVSYKVNILILVKGTNILPITIPPYLFNMKINLN